MKKINIKDLIVPIVIAILLTLISWYLLNSLLLAIAFGIGLFAGLFYIFKLAKKNDLLFKNINSSYNFVNLMNVAMLSCNSIYEGYKSIENYISNDFSNIANEDIHLQLTEIANEYNLNSFKMYINTLLIYDDEGGNFKEMEVIPSSLCQKTKVYYEKLKSAKYHKIIEITTLYLMWLLVFAFMKISITNYYDLMLENTLYQVILLAILLLGGFIYILALKEYLTNSIRGL